MIHGLINISAGGKLKSVKTFLAFAQKRVCRRERKREREGERKCVWRLGPRELRESGWVGGRTTC